VHDVARLIQEGRMTEHGLEEVDAAKADGRWDRAYGSGKEMKIPDDLQAAIDAEPKARKMLTSLSEQNRFALAFRVHNMKTAAGRQKKIEALVDMLKRGETIYPQEGSRIGPHRSPTDSEGLLLQSGRSPVPGHGRHANLCMMKRVFCLADAAC
jgi:Bacteriocin-protection, YdeI or OmpD-Associated